MRTYAVQLHLPRLHDADRHLLAVMARFTPSDISIEWSKPTSSCGGGGRWWTEQPVFESLPLDGRTIAGVEECLKITLHVLTTSREINADVIHRMQVPESYGAQLPAYADAC